MDNGAPVSSGQCDFSPRQTVQLILNTGQCPRQGGRQFPASAQPFLAGEVRPQRGETRHRKGEMQILGANIVRLGADNGFFGARRIRTGARCNFLERDADFQGFMRLNPHFSPPAQGEKHFFQIWLPIF